MLRSGLSSSAGTTGHSTHLSCPGRRCVHSLLACLRPDDADDVEEDTMSQHGEASTSSRPEWPLDSFELPRSTDDACSPLAVPLVRQDAAADFRDFATQPAKDTESAFTLQQLSLNVSFLNLARIRRQTLPRSRQTLPQLRPRTLKCSHLGTVESEMSALEPGQDQAADFATELADFATPAAEDTETLSPWNS